MNLFILDADPKVAAKYYQDLHINKIIVEGCQVLAAAYPIERLAQDDCPRTQKGTPRKHGHYNHPVTVWVREHMSNFKWTLEHVYALYMERLHRFNKYHFGLGFLEWCTLNSPELAQAELTEHPQCFQLNHPECVVPGDPVKGYQNYYNKAKREFKFGNKIIKATWTNRDVPYFFTNP
jgi:hypothetical protein